MIEPRKKSRDAILSEIRSVLHREPDSAVAPRPPVVPPRVPAAPDAEIEKLCAEINALKGVARRLSTAGVKSALAALVETEGVKKAVLWNTPLLATLGVAAALRVAGVEVIPHQADKLVMAEADLGVTEADFALPETGTLGLLSSSDKPRSVSLLPRVHLAIVQPAALRPDLSQVFSEAKKDNYLILITGPSRTSDIEMTTTIGVHGPKTLYVWMLDN